METIAECATRHLRAGVTDLTELSRLVGADLGREVSARTLKSYGSQFRRHGADWLARDNEKCAAWRSANRRRHVELTLRWQVETDPVAYAWAQMRKRTRELSLPPMSITKAELEELFAPMRCSLTGLPLDWAHGTRDRRNPWRASPDRIDAGLGYAPGNVRAVCFAANALLNSFGLGAVLPLAREALARRDAGLPAFDEGTGAALLAARVVKPGGSARAAAPRRTLASSMREQRSKGRSRRSARLPFTITTAWVESELRRGTCAATGLPLVHRHPMLRPSIDRVDSSLGYVEENCRVVCHLANLGKAEWDDGVLWRVLDGMVSERRESNPNGPFGPRGFKPLASTSSATLGPSGPSRAWHRGPGD